MREKRDIARRDLFAGAAAAAIGAVGTQSQATAQTLPWDLEADIVCVGSGAAASSAAVSAVDRGATVIMLEKQPATGGTTRKSSGVIWVPNNFLLRARGVKDKRSDCLKYMARMSYPQNYVPDSPTLGLSEREYKLLAAYYDNCSHVIDRLRELKIAEFQEFKLFSINEPAPDYGEHLSENKVPTGRGIAMSEGATDFNMGGSSLLNAVEAWLKKRGVDIRTGHRVTAVIKEGGCAAGVVAETNGKMLRIKARKGVIFGTGGYAQSAELVARHQIALYGACARTGSTGDFIGIAGEAGAAMGALHTAWRTQVLVEEALQNRALGVGAFFLPGDSMLVVNKYGRRCVNEKRGYNERTHAHFYFDPTREEYTNHLMFMVFDDRVMGMLGGNYPFPEDRRDTRFLAQGDTLEELSASIAKRLAGISEEVGGVMLDPSFPAALKDQVDRFNGYASTGRDLEFERGLHLYDRQWHRLFSRARPSTKYPDNPMPNVTMHPLAPRGPYFAYILAAGAVDTNSGPLINENAQVLAPSGQPIPGLYGAGNCIACPTREAYVAGGITIGLAMTYGHIAAVNALKGS